MKTIRIDCAELETANDFHNALAQALEFPDYYGKNLDALYDCLTEVDTEQELILDNWHQLEYRLKDYSGKALFVFHEACLENENLTVTLHP